MLIFSLLTIVCLTHSVKYTGIIKLIDLYNYPNYVITNLGYFPEHDVLYYNVQKQKETLQVSIKNKKFKNQSYTEIF